MNLIKIGSGCGVLLASIVAVHATATQTPEPRTLPISRTVVSPEVLPDRRVTFRIYAPKASDVLVLIGGERTKMEKDERGVWSVTVGPLPSDSYAYFFRVDDMPVPDVKNVEVLSALNGFIYSSVFVPGPDAEFMENKAVPHGEVRRVWYRSSTLGVQRRMHVYTPPGYEATSTPYPVLYLLHGGGELDSSWSTVGRAGFIVDNLIASQKATPMVVVMPDVPVPPARDRFVEELLKDIVPHVEKTYRVRAGRDARALAGFSVGGYQTLNVLTSHSAAFCCLGVWSAPVEPKTVVMFGQEQKRFLSDADQINKRMKLLWFRMGSEDMGIPHVKALTAMLTEHGIKHDLKISAGTHSWQNWRRYLHEFAQAIFR